MSVSTIGSTQSTAAAALAKAKEEIAAEQLTKGVAAFKVKLRALEAAKLVVENLEREIADLQAKIEQGNYVS